MLEVVRKLAGFEIAAAEWESSVLPVRVRGYRPEWLDQLVLTGEVAWGRVWGSGNSPVRSTPLCLMPREDLELWLSLARTAEGERPRLARQPVLRAADSPRLSWRTQRMPSRLAATAGVSSTEPSSTTMTSKFLNVCRRTLSTASRRKRPSL